MGDAANDAFDRELAEDDLDEQLEEKQVLQDMQPEEPNDCDFCSRNFLSAIIHYCPDCGLCYCESCWDREHSCYDEDESI